MRFISITPLAVLLFLSALPQSSHGQTLVAHWQFDGNANDATGNGNNGTVNGATPCKDRFGSNNSAYEFDGGDWISVAHSAGLAFGSTSNFTINAWVKMCRSMSDFAGLVAKGPDLTNYPGYQMFVRSSANIGGEVGLSNGNWVRTQGATNITNGVWRMVTMQVSTSSGFLRFYVNGVLEASVNGTSIDPTLTYTRPLYIGRDRNSLAYFMGAIDDVRIYDGLLTTTDLQALFSANGWPISSGSQTVDVTVRSLDPTAFCTGGFARLEGTGNADSYRWEPATGLSTTSGLTTIARPITTTTYRIIGTKDFGDRPCSTIASDTATVTITVNPGPSLSLNRNEYICAGQTTRIGANATGGLPPYTYKWTPAAGLNDDTSPTPTLTPGSVQKYIVTVTDAGGCVLRDSVMPTVLAAPVLTLRDMSICRGSAGDSVRLVAVGSNNPLRFKWAPAKGLDADSVAQPIANPDSTTQYTVTVTDGAGCVSTARVLVRVNPAVNVNAGADVIICPGDSTSIGTAAATGLRYAWIRAQGLADTSLATPVVHPLSTTTYIVTAIDPATGCQDRDSVTVRVRESLLNFSSTSVDFGSLDGCTSSRELTFFVRNTGNDSVSIGGADVAGAGFVVTSLPTKPIAPGDSARITVRFAPQTPGGSSGTITIRSAECLQTWTINLTGIKQALLASASPLAVDFDLQLTCTSAAQDTVIWVYNSGGAPMTIDPVLVNSPFTVTAPTLPQTVPAGDSIALTVHFAPGGAGAFVGDLRIPFRTGTCVDTIRVALRQTTARPAIAAAAVVDYGTLTGCQSSIDTIITLTNVGVVPVSVDSATTVGDYVLASQVPSTIAAGASAQLTIRFVPQASGTKTGRIVVYYGPCTDSIEIDLAGVKQGVAFEVPDTLEFGDLISCRYGDTSRTLDVVLRNDAGGSGSISAVAVTGPFTSTAAAGAPLRNGVSEPFVVTFTPTADGAVQGEIVLTLQPCNVTRRVILRASSSRASIAFAGPITFGSQMSGIAVERDVALTNTGPHPVTVDSVSTTAPFAVVGTVPPLPAVIASGAQVVVTVRYTPRTGTDSSNLNAHASEPCVLMQVTTISGVGDERALAVIRVPSLHAAPGETIAVPILLDSSAGLDAVGAKKFTATLSFHRSLLVPNDRTGVTEQDTTRRVVVTGERRPGSAVLAEVAMTATLGSRESMPILIEQFTWIDAVGEVVVRTIDGLFTLDSICREGSTRLFSSDNAVLLRPLRPNPARHVVEVEFEVFEPGETRLEVQNVLGRCVQTIVHGMIDAGQHHRVIDVGDMPPGAYVIVLRTPTLVRSRRMEVVR